ncbi:hypothetical protein KHQ81_15750 (plasmid) [Mycoplasmatota bacterium]|nr:hypothetical protein KHQ81_15750 [Mycoplasmatota bacterium]
MRKYKFILKITKNGINREITREIEVNRELNVNNKEEVNEFIKKFELLNAVENGFIDSYEVKDCFELS